MSVSAPEKPGVVRGGAVRKRHTRSGEISPHEAHTTGSRDPVTIIAAGGNPLKTTNGARQRAGLDSDAEGSTGRVARSLVEERSRS